MNRLILALPTCLIISLSAIADDNLCKALLVPGRGVLENNVDYCIHQSQRVGINKLTVERDLLVQAVLELRALRNNVIEVRDELVKARNDLQKAKANFESSVQAMAITQVQWRKEALDKTIDSISKLPARLAEEQTLRDGLKSALKSELIQDAAFLQSIRQATKW